MALELLFTAEELYSRISKSRVSECLNDSGSGEADEDAVTQLITDCTLWVRGKIGPVAELSTLTATTAGDLKRIALDVARAYLCERAPEVMRQSSKDIFERCARDIKMIRIGEASPGTEVPPDPLANNGASVTSGNPAEPDCIPPRFSDNWGDFG